MEGGTTHSTAALSLETVRCLRLRLLFDFGHAIATD